MTLPIIWRANARSDLAAIIRYVANVNPIAARRLREIVAHPNYIVYYRVTAHCIEVVNVIHTRREFPEGE